MDPADLFVDHPFGLEVLGKVSAELERFDDIEFRTGKSQVALRRKRGFAYLWPPGKYLSNTDVEVVLSIVLGRHDDSSRWKEVVQPSPRHWMHHLEVRDLEEIDDQVVGWLIEAAERAA